MRILRMLKFNSLVIYFSVIFSIYATGGAFAATYYVSPNGMVGNGGTLSQPFRTLQRAANTAVEGDIVYIRGGTYEENVDFSTSGTGSDTAGLIRFIGYPNETPVFSGRNLNPSVQANRDGFSINTGVDYLHFENITIRYYDRHCIVGEGTGHRWIVFQDLDISYCNGDGINFEGSQTTTSNLRFIRVSTHNNSGHGMKAVGYSHYFEDCESYNNGTQGWNNGTQNNYNSYDGNGIQLSNNNWGTTIIKGCTIYDNGAESPGEFIHGIRYCPNTAGYRPGYIEGNTIYNNNERGISFECGGQADGITIRDNYIYGNGNDGIYGHSDTHNTTISNNRIYDNAGWGARFDQATGNAAAGNVMYGNSDGNLRNVTDNGNTFNSTLPPACTSFTYSNWSPAVCPSSETQTRSVASSSPSGCTEGNPDTTRECTYTPPSTLPGDVNIDDAVNVLDVQACVNHVLEVQDWGSAADVNGDGNVDVLDVQEIVNVILGGA